MLRVLFITLLFALLVGCGSKTEPDKKKSSSPSKKGYSPPPVQVEVSKITKKNLQVKVDVVGTTLPLRRVNLSSAVAGKIAKIDLQEGMIVKKGQPLVKVDTYAWKAKIAEKKAECRRWKAEIEKLNNGYMKEDLARTQAVLKEKESALRRLEVEKNRSESLLKQNGVSKSDWDQVRFSYAEMVAQVEQARADFEKMQSGSRYEDIKIAKAHLETAEAQLLQAEDNFRHTTVSAPFDGIISKKQVELDEWLSTGTVIAELVDLSKVRVQVAIAEKFISLVRVGMKAKVKLDAFPGRETWGTVSAIIPRTEGLARNFPVELIIENPKQDIYEGMFCRVEGILREAEGALMIHRDAFIHKHDKISVARITKDHSIEMVEIITGAREGEWFEVTSSDLKENDLVVVTNNNKVYPGAKVIITKGL